MKRTRPLAVIAVAALVLAIFASALFPGAAYADTYSSQPDGTSGYDNFILNTAATTNFGTDGAISIGEVSGETNNIRRTLLKFDLSSIPSSATIESATLSLWINVDYASASSTINVYRLKMNWGETTSTWNNYATGTAWQTSGALGANDYDSTSSGSKTLTASEAANTEEQITLSVTEVTKLINGTYTNYGWLLKTSDELNDCYNYYSSDYSTSGYRPKLVIVYSTATATPTVTATFTATNTPTRTATNTPTSTATNTATNTPTFTPTFTLTPTETFTPSATNVFTDTPTNTPTETLTPSPTSIYSETPTFTPSVTYTPTLTFTPGGPTLTPNATEWYVIYSTRVAGNDSPVVPLLAIACVPLILIPMAGYILWLVFRKRS